MDDRTTAQDRPAFRYVSAPTFVGELFVVRDPDIGPVHPYGNVARHLVCATNQRQTIPAVQIAVPLVVHELLLLNHFNGIETSGRDQRCRLAVRERKVWVDDEPALSVRLVGPVTQRRLHRTTDLSFPRAVGAEGHNGIL